MSAAYVTMLYELSALRLIEVVWPEPDTYCHARRSTATVHFRCDLAYAALIAQHVQYLEATGLLSTPWRVSVVAHMSAVPCSFKLEPTNAADARADWLDLGAIAARFHEQVRRIAAMRLALLDARRSEQSRARLTSRERDVLELFLAGFGVASIAQRLFVSPHTVRSHMKRLFAKFGVSSQRELREQFSN